MHITHTHIYANDNMHSCMLFHACGQERWMDMFYCNIYYLLLYWSAEYLFFQQFAPFPYTLVWIGMPVVVTADHFVFILRKGDKAIITYRHEPDYRTHEKNLAAKFLGVNRSIWFWCFYLLITIKCGAWLYYHTSVPWNYCHMSIIDGSLLYWHTNAFLLCNNR